MPPAKKRAIVSAVLKAAGEVSPEWRAPSSCWRSAAGSTCSRIWRRRSARRCARLKAIVPAEVVTAAPLSDAQRAALAAARSPRRRALTVTMDARVDPAIVGGVIARVGSVVFDGSVTTQIERMRQRLIEER